MRRLISGIVLSLCFASIGEASLETDCYLTGGYFGSTYYASGYFDESCGAPPGGSTGFPLRLRKDLRIMIN